MEWFGVLSDSRVAVSLEAKRISSQFSNSGLWPPTDWGLFSCLSSILSITWYELGICYSLNFDDFSDEDITEDLFAWPNCAVLSSDC